MQHRSTKSTIMLVDVALTFEDVYKKPYFAKAYYEEIKKANLLLLPSENIREGLEPVFPELTSQFLRYLKEHAPEDVIVDIAVDDEHFHKLLLYAPQAALATVLIREEVLQATAKLVVGFLEETAKQNLRYLDEMDTFVNIITQGKHGNKKIMFAGRVSELKEALENAISQGYREE